MVQRVPRHHRVGRLASVFVGEEARPYCLDSMLSHLRHHGSGYVHGHDALNMQRNGLGKCPRTGAEVYDRARCTDPQCLELRDIFGPVGR